MTELQIKTNNIESTHYKLASATEKLFNEDIPEIKNLCISNVQNASVLFSNNPNHFGDLYVGIFSDLIFPEKDLTLKQGWHRMPVLVNLFFRC